MRWERRTEQGETGNGDSLCFLCLLLFSLERPHLAEKDNAVVENALAYALTGEGNYARHVPERFVGEAREQMPHYEKLDIKAQPEWGRWSWWGATAWAYDLAYDAFLADAQTREFIASNNPAALREIAERFEEAAARGLWTPRANSAYDLLKEFAQ